jgi:CHAD domain
MRMKNKIKKRLVKINAFLSSKKKPTLKSIHLLRLEVKHLEAFTELMTIQHNFGARSAIPDRLGKLFSNAGKLRTFELETGAIQSIAKNKRLSKPTLFLQQLGLSKKKSSNRLHKKRRAYHPFKIREFAKHPDYKLSFHTLQKFLASRASSILDLLTKDIMADIRSLHQLRKILKSILYVLPFCKKRLKSARVLLKTNKKFIKYMESLIGSLHDTDYFVTWLEMKHNIIHASEEKALIKIKKKWQNDIKRMMQDLQPMLPAIRQFALDLKDHSTENLKTANMSFI